MLGSSSRATDGDFSSAGMFKLGDDGQLTAIGVFVDEDGKESRSDLTVSPAAVYNLTDDYIGFEYCRYFDKDGDEVYATDEYYNLIVRRSDGLVFSAKGIGGFNNVPTFNPLGSSYAEDGAGHLLAAFYTFSPDNPGYIGRITLAKGKGTWEQLSTDGSPIQYSDYPKVFAMNNGLVGMTVGCNQDGYSSVGRASGIIYPNGGYDAFLEANNSYACYLVLDDAILELSQNPKYIHLGTAYGESAVEVLPKYELLTQYYGIRSWYETSDKVIFNDSYKKYVAFDKRTKQTTAFELQYEDNLYLWKENLCSDGRFYGIAKENGKVCKAVSFDPVTLDYTEKDLNIANEIDITYIANDSRNAKAQMTGTRRSDGYKVAVSVDLKTGRTDIIFSDPNRAIISLIPLN